MTRYNKKEVEEFVYFYLRKNKKISPPVVARKFGMTWENAYYIFKKLIYEGKIKRVGRAYLINSSSLL